MPKLTVVEVGSFTHRIQQRFSNLFDRLILIRLVNDHWTIWDYCHLGDTVTCRAINPMNNLSQLESVDHETHWAVINGMRKMDHLPEVNNVDTREQFWGIFRDPSIARFALFRLDSSQNQYHAASEQSSLRWHQWSASHLTRPRSRCWQSKTSSPILNPHGLGFSRILVWPGMHDT